MVAEYRVYLVYTSWYGHLNRENAHQPGDLGVPNFQTIPNGSLGMGKCLGSGPLSRIIGEKQEN